MTDEQSKEFIQNVQREVKVLRVAEFRKRVQADPFLLDKSEKNEIFFFRQRLIGKSLEPELTPMCICGVIWSPLDPQEIEECDHCSGLFHPVCMRQHSDLRCNDCKAELPKKLVYRHLNAMSTTTLERDVTNSLSQKRQKTDETPIDKIAKVEKIAYPSLSPGRSQLLDDYISQLK